MTIHFLSFKFFFHVWNVFSVVLGVGKSSCFKQSGHFLNLFLCVKKVTDWKKGQVGFFHVWNRVEKSFFMRIFLSCVEPSGKKGLFCFVMSVCETTEALWGKSHFFFCGAKLFFLLLLLFFSCMKKMLSQEYSSLLLNRMKNKHFHDFFVWKLQKELLY